MTVVNVSLLLGDDPDGFHLSEEYLWLRFLECFLLLIPSAAFNEESLDEDAVLCWFAKIVLVFVRNDLEVKVNGIDGDHILSCVVLLGTSQEGLCEIEARDPEYWWCTMVNPVLDELEASQEVLDP